MNHHKDRMDLSKGSLESTSLYFSKKILLYNRISYFSACMRENYTLQATWKPNSFLVLKWIYTGSWVTLMG